MNTCISTSPSPRQSRALRLDTFDDDWKNRIGIKPLQAQPPSQQQQRQQQRQNPLSSQILASLSSAEGSATQPGISSSNVNGIDKKDPSGTGTTETRPPPLPAVSTTAPSTQAQGQVTVRAPTPPLEAAAATPPPPPPQQQQQQRVRQQQQPPPRYQNRWWESPGGGGGGGGPNRF